jgi:hypothetical protein
VEAETLKLPEIIRELRRPFKPSQVKFRQSGGGVVAYIDARAAADRLNRVAPGWSSAFSPSALGVGVECQITIAGVTRADVGFSEGRDEMAVKAAYSDAFKRAAATWSIASSLYAYKPIRWSGQVDGDALKRMRAHYEDWTKNPAVIDHFGPVFEEGE